MGALELRHEHRQSQTLSPRLQHAVRLLQMSSLDFSTMVTDMLGRNPFLEVTEGSEDGAPMDGDMPMAETPAMADMPDTMPDDREIWRAESGGSLRRAEDGEMSALEMTAAQTCLREHLRGQLNVLRLSNRDLLLASIVAESVDDDGYLRISLEELAAVSQLNPPPEPGEMQIALKRVQALDPLGVGARSVGECLLLQLSKIECARSRVLAERIITQHLNLLASRDVPALAQLLDITVAEAEAVCLKLRRFDPRPGWRYETTQAPYIVPDVLTTKVRGQWRVQLNPAVIPKVRMNQVYAELFQRHRNQGHSELANHLQEARWTMRNIEQRFSTILDVADAIVRRQRHFLEFGAMAMKPLGLKEIADEVGIHESTVSRVTNNKYLATPTGVYELKYFFSRAIVSSNGSACSGTAIRGLIKDIIEAEKPDSPLSDAEITRQLSRQGLVVARRTVTKYRQMLRIEAVDRRRQHS
ncbi:RNA polymerase, sigma 54 subunit, RpoN/SigL [Roseateles sp. YR242]|uniref:RNA polymerase factor sigma-54 n=1 Tax=Roseateles sp. YR242 TaxID=1855305 RepID=UPI0008C08EC1|nr:RNA polymerase factor sigma-54 [Roseateles sp. YR242]SEL18936.1 RNA polymerase, sigma 54 subunit, RpoN/SigL [Roseateles sp. YR242]